MLKRQLYHFFHGDFLSLEPERSKKSELLMGVFIGLYGNWLISFVDKLGNTGVIYSYIAFVISMGFLFLYFAEVYTKLMEQTWVKIFPLKLFLGIIHISFILLAQYLSGIFEQNIFFSATGFALSTQMGLRIFETSNFAVAVRSDL